MWGVKVTHYCFPHGLHYTEESDSLFLKGGEWYDLPLGLWENEINVFFSNSSTKYQYKKMKQNKTKTSGNCIWSKTKKIMKGGSLGWLRG